MKHRRIRKLASFLLIFILIFQMLPITASAATSVSIRPDIEYQTFRGFGTSLSWWANEVGTWNSTAKKNEILDLLYDPNKGLGLTVARYNIGGGDDPSHHHMRNGADIPGFLSADGTFDPNADAGQRSILQGAMRRGVNLVEGFAKTPPYFMTLSGCASGNVNGTSNCNPDYYDDFANYLADVYELYRDTYGITFDSISPINEPNGPWWEINNRQEGCHYTHAEQNELFKTFQQVFQSRGLGNVCLAGPEGFEYNATLGSLGDYDAQALSAISKFNTHSYYGNERLFLHTLALSKGKRVSVSEYGVGVGDHNHQAVDSALELAHKIRDDVHDLQPETWVYWQAVEEEFDVNNWGFIHADFNGAETYEITKQYYGMANFSKFIRPGATIIGANNSDILAAFDKNNHKLTLVVINSNKNTKDYSLDLSGFSSLGGSAKVYRTSDSESLAQLGDASLSGSSLNISAAPRSITTYVIDGAYSNATPRFDQSKSYRIVNKENNNMVVDIQNGSTANSADVVLHSKTGAASQNWRLIVNDNGDYYLANVNAAKMLDVPGASKDDCATMKLWQPNGDNNQLWQIKDLGNGYFSIINKNSGKALGVQNGTIADNTYLDQYTFHSYDNQQWKFEIAN
ncbi:MAG: RICIN domain-containing protein [Lachnospiraceae bacterium]|nr:RICIN domain-containing protein [Lachnospiraceae bacterium]